MKEKDIIVTVKKLPNGSFVQVMSDGRKKVVQGNTDWNKVFKISEEEISLAAQQDLDNPLSTKQELKKFQSIPDIKIIRNKLHMTQEEFSKSFHLPLGTIRDWEQGVRQPDTAARVLLQVISRIPKEILKALRASGA
jgi:putative transcriptional regulator